MTSPLEAVTPDPFVGEARSTAPLPREYPPRRREGHLCILDRLVDQLDRLLDIVRLRRHVEIPFPLRRLLRVDPDSRFR